MNCRLHKNHKPKFPVPIDENVLKIGNLLYPNQIIKQGSKHHDSEGIIHSIGYAAKFNKIDENEQLSFSKFVHIQTRINKELQTKSLEESQQLYEECIYSHLEFYVNRLRHILPNILSMISPDISQLQNQFDLALT